MKNLKKFLQRLPQLTRRPMYSQLWQKLSLQPRQLENMDPSLECKIIPSNFQWLLNEAPAFLIPGSKIKVITHPKSFYNELLTRTQTSSKRIILTSLYLGIGELEKKLVSSIEDRVRKCDNLRVHWLLDHTRGSRGHPSSRTMLLPLITDSPHNCMVSLYHTPDLRGFLRKIIPQRWNETIGLQHMKLYIFDNTLIISGANLSSDYFTNRQDRYIVFEDCKELADFYEKVVNTVSNFSFKLEPDNTTSVQPLSGIHPLEDTKSKYCYLVKSAIDTFWRQECRLSQERIRQLQHTSNFSVPKDNLDTVVFPTLQMGPFKVNYDGLITKRILSDSAEFSLIKLASGYFNLTEQYMNCVLYGSANFEILCAHPKANGFLGAKGFAGAIPAAYTHIAKMFFNRVLQNNQKSRISLHEYQRKDWTFHGKGLWYYLPETDLPILTMVGSPNFGWRSTSRDLESQVVMITQNKNLQESLHKEQHELYSKSDRVSQSTYKEETRYVPVWVRLIMPVIKVFF